MDYGALIDDETWAFIRETESWYPADAVTLSVADQRAIYDAMCRAFYQGTPDGINVSDTQANGVPVRIYAAGDPTRNVVYFHGGGFVVGGLDSHDDVCAEICLNTGYRVISVDYRLAPEHVHPAALEDSCAAVDWALAHFEGGVVLAGDSAGGNLAAAVSHRFRSRIAGQVLIYPDLGGDVNAGSYLSHSQAPLLSRDEVLYYHDIRGAGAEGAPLQGADFKGLPPTVVFAAQCDPLCDDGPAYVAKLRAAQRRGHCVIEPGLVHGFLRARTSVTRARDSFERIVLAIEALGQGLWPY